jgi:copper(I)-binding protein
MGPSSDARSRLSLGAAISLLCAGLLLSACGHPQEVLQSGTIGANAQVGDVLLRNVYVENPAQAGYPGGSNAIVRLTLVNRASRPDTLTDVTTDAAQRVEILADPDCDGTAETLSSLRLPARVDTSSPSNGPGPNDTGYGLRLVDLRTGLLQGGIVPILFTFQHAGSITIPTPIDARPGATTAPSRTCSDR